MQSLEQVESIAYACELADAERWCNEDDFYDDDDEDEWEDEEDA